MTDPIYILITAFVLDFCIGDPNYSWHPVRLFGNLITRLEKLIRDKGVDLQTGALILPLVATTIAVGFYLILHDILSTMAWVLDIYVLYALIALKDLLEHGKRVRVALEADDLAEARNNVQMLVGRNTAQLDEHGVARAAIESLAENLVDGFISPVFWFMAGSVIFGSPTEGIAAVIGFKVISTLDSMVGYRNSTYEVLGSISAKLDDILNFVPARLSIPLITVAAHFTSNQSKAAWNMGWRDRHQHASPNSAHAEAAVAGALDLKLGGPSEYHGKMMDKPWIGAGRTEATANDLRKTSELIKWTAILSIASAVLIMGW